ncbi:hypothetical protein [Minwuia sp.]|uniref:hypothetical protein n=1 Tax=Minwuia sp. TaxID=2493630 RepID=UPI003A9555AF
MGLSGLQTANSISSAKQQQRLSRSKSRLELARQKRDSAENLARGLAKQNVVGSARGVATTSGSLMRQALTASRAARRNVGLATGLSELENASAAVRTRAGINKALISFGDTLAEQGPKVFRQ